jgi:hypothetical protein
MGAGSSRRILAAAGGFACLLFTGCIATQQEIEDLRADILRLQPRDTPGVVLFTLRALYPTAQAFLAAAVAQAVHTWWPTPAQVAA